MAGQLTIGVLGGLSVARAGCPVPMPPSRKTRALLAYLAVVGRPQRREHLCRMFWEVPEDPRASLRWSLYKIRQVLDAAGEPCLRGGREFVSLDPARFELDIRRLDGVTPARLAALDGPTLEALAGVAEGEFLDGLELPRCPAFEAWRVHHAAVVRRRRAEIARALKARHLPVSAGLAAQLALTDEEPVAPPASSPPGQVPPEPTALPPSGAAVSNLDTAVRKRPLSGQRVRFCRASDGVRIAYGAAGEGPPLVRAAHWMTHLHYDLESPVWRHWMESLATGATLVRYDQRGNGLSDWDVAEFGFGAMLGDLEAVVDAAGLDRFTLLGVSQSCSVAVAYAVRHPHRVSRLILYGGFAKGWRRRGDRHEIATHEAMTTLMREGWGSDTPLFRELFTHMLMPGADEEQTAWFNELQRVTVSPENASRLHEAFGEFDVSALLPQVQVPALVLHARGDMAVPFQSGREFATGIADARFVSLDSTNHILLADEPAFGRFVQEVRGFMAEPARR